MKKLKDVKVSFFENGNTKTVLSEPSLLDIMNITRSRDKNWD